MKRIVTIFIILLGVGLLAKKSINFGANSGKKPTSSLDSDIQAIEVKQNGKYKEIKKTKLADGTEYQVNEYVDGNGEAGYQVILFKDGQTKSYGIGPEAKNWSYDWTTSSPTTTL